jgi:hypothetical protein
VPQQLGHVFQLLLGREPRVVRDMLEDEGIHLVLGNRIEAELHRSAEPHFRSIHLGGTIGHDPPAALPSELRLRGIREQCLTRLREDSVGRNEQVVSFAPPIGKRDFNASWRLCQLRYFGPQGHTDPGLTDAAGHDLVQDRAHDAAAARDRRSVSRNRRCFHDDAAVGLAQPNPGTDKALFPHLAEDPEVVESSQRQSGHADAGTVRPPVRIGVRQLDLDPTPGERKSCAHPADAAADHERFADHRAVSPSRIRPEPATGPCRGSLPRAAHCR